MKNFHKYIQEKSENNPELKGELELESWIFEIGYNIARIRNEKGYSQKEFAEKLGMSQSTIARIESGQNMTCETLWKISEILEENLEVFGANTESEKQKVTYFYSLPIKSEKSFISSTSDEESFTYQTEPSNTSIISNIFSYYGKQPIM